MGRWIAKYPIGLSGGLNTYIYVEDNPLNYIDSLWANITVGVGILLIGGRVAGAVISRVLQNAVSTTGGAILACALTGYCSGETDGKRGRYPLQHLTLMVKQSIISTMMMVY